MRSTPAVVDREADDEPVLDRHLPFLKKSPMISFNQIEKLAYEMGYRINDQGEIIGMKGRPLIGWADRWGYRLFRVGHDVGSAYVHRMVAYQQFGDKLYEPGTEVRHLDGNCANNEPTNLALGTASDNAQDKLPEVRRRAAVNAASYVRKLTETQVVQLREDRKQGATYLELMEKYKISSKGTISSIVNRKTYV